MKKEPLFLLCLILAALPLLRGQSASQTILFRGEVSIRGVPFTGSGYFKFVITDRSRSISHWSNDGSSSQGEEPVGSIPILVEKGKYQVLLGSSDFPPMPPIPSQVLQKEELFLIVWFNDVASGPSFQRLLPDVKLRGIGFTYKAQLAEDARTLEGKRAADFEPAGTVKNHEAAYGHLTPKEKEELTGGAETSLHTHLPMRLYHSIQDTDPLSTIKIHIHPAAANSVRMYLYGSHLKGLPGGSIPMGVQLWIDGKNFTEAVSARSKVKRDNWGSVAENLILNAYTDGELADMRSVSWEEIVRHKSILTKLDNHLHGEELDEILSLIGPLNDSKLILTWEGFIRFPSSQNYYLQLTSSGSAFLQIQEKGEWKRVLSKEASQPQATGSFANPSAQWRRLRLALGVTAEVRSIKLEYSTDLIAEKKPLTLSWLRSTPLWGVNGKEEWATGELNLTELIDWSSGDHLIEIRETGGKGGRLAYYIYVN
ncbi:hypothetical protein CEE39_07350 [bacterium (candidate division B38) B3_B38]|nr:MAG: hypothetical protein CEE39_07350 [bacterium (candidate division B38) B3_B38]